MKRFVFLLALVVVLIFSLKVAAGNWEIVGGVTQNNMNIKTIETDGSWFISGNAFYGTGYYSGGRYWVTPQIAVGLGYDHWEGNWYQSSPTYTNYHILRLTGPYLEAVYKLNDLFNVSGFLASYNYAAISATEDAGYEEEVKAKGQGTGYGIKAELEYPFYNNISLLASAGYKASTIDIDFEDSSYIFDTYKVFGFSYSLGISYNF